jgi:hypothetical protein
MSRRALLGTGIAFVLIAATSVLAAFGLRSDVPRVAGARRLLPLPGGAPHYWWLSDTELLLLRSPANPTFVRRTIDAVAETPLPNLNSLFRETSGSPETIRVSPDGAHLLWSPQDRTRTIVSTMDGTTHNTVKHVAPSVHLWNPNGKLWAAIEIHNDRLGMTHMYAVDKPGAALKTVPLSAPPSVQETNVPRAVITADGMFLVQLWNGPDQPMRGAHLVLLAFTPNAMFTRQLDFEAPHDNDGGEVFFSPDRFLMGWTLRMRTPLQKLTGAGCAPKRYNTGFWVTDQSKRQTKGLGYIETVRDDPNSGPFNPQLSPDGKYLSYVYQNALYLLPIPPT